MEDDVKLYKDFLLGNQGAFDTLMDKYRKHVICFINNYVKNVDIAEDLSQDVFVYILINKKEYDFKYSMKTYLYTIARSRALNYLKREKRIVYFEENKCYENGENYINVMEEEIFSKEKSDLVHSAIKQLNFKQQRAIYLSDIEEMSYSEIAKILGKTIPQTKMIIYRARKNIKEIIGKEEVENG